MMPVVYHWWSYERWCQ